MFGLGMPELLIVLLIVFLLFGAKRLPSIASALGKAIREFKNQSDGGERKSQPEEPQNNTEQDNNS